MTNISIVAPLYNETESFPLLVKRLNKLMDSTPLSIEVVLVNDGSRDNTAELMHQLALTDNRYHCVFLARNYGHQIALSAGLSKARGTEGVMVIDGDLQDPPELLFDFYEKYKQGYDVVYAIRQKRKENVLKKAAYRLFYRLLKSISYIDIPLDSGDFCFMSRRVVDVMNAMPEESRYIRGMRSWIGFEQIGVPYERAERAAGDSKYSFRKLLQLAYNGIFNFSEFPIKLIKRVGYASVGISFLYLVYSVYRKLIYDDVPQGFTATIFIIIFFSGIQLFFMGIMGEYLLRIFFQVKGRPLFIVKNEILDGKLVNK
ncbi:MAG: glycosyltransferase family 2 protein [Saprospiraceae bacterium]|nr:glycosyltransferase family 2 protein [Saprospiraceae bacterium]